MVEAQARVTPGGQPWVELLELGHDDPVAYFQAYAKHQASITT